MGILDFLKRKTTPQVQYVENGIYNYPMVSMQNDREFIEETIYKVTWIFACIDKICTCSANVPWLLYKKQANGGLKEITNHPILDTINKPNEFMNGTDLITLWTGGLALNGKFFALFDSPINPTRIEPLPPPFVKVIPSKDAFVSGIEFEVSSYKKIFPSNLVLWSKFIDFLNYYEGLSCVRALSKIINTEQLINIWNNTMISNSGVPAGCFMVDQPSPSLIEDIKKRWLREYAGTKNARIPLVIDSSRASYKSFGINQVDMDYVEQKKNNRIEICSAFGVPPQLIGDPQAQTYANYEEAIKSFWMNTIIPKYLVTIKNSLNNDFVSKYDTSLYLDFDISTINALSESLDVIERRILNKYRAKLITLNEARNELGYEDIEGGDKILPNQTNNKDTENELDDDINNNDTNSKKGGCYNV